MRSITALLMAMLGMVVGTYLISPVNTATAAITTAAYGASVASISSLLPLFLVIIIILNVFKGFESV